MAMIRIGWVKESSQAGYGSTQNVEVRGPSTRACQDWTVHFSSVKYDNRKQNVMASDVSEANTGL
jgi:hypothetical protein